MPLSKKPTLIGSVCGLVLGISLLVVGALLNEPDIKKYGIATARITAIKTETSAGCRSKGWIH